MEYLIYGLYLGFTICQTYNIISNIKLGLIIYKAYKKERYNIQVKRTKFLTISQHITKILLVVIGFSSLPLTCIFVGNIEKYGIVLSVFFHISMKIYFWFLICFISLQIICFITYIVISILYYLHRNNKLKQSGFTPSILPLYSFFQEIYFFKNPIFALSSNMIFYWIFFILYLWFFTGHLLLFG